MSITSRMLAVLLVWSAAVQAHDFWIEPSTFRPVPNQTVAVSLRVGEDFIGDAIPRSASLIESFVIRDGAGVRSVNGLENRDPAGYVRLVKSNVAVIGYTSKPYRTELPAAKFNEFLEQEGLARVRALRRQREHFSRFAKAIVGSGSGPIDATFGWRFEIVPVTSPFTAAPLRVRVVLDGQPLPAALITALHRDHSDARIALRSDANGTVTLPLTKKGVWLVKCVALVPAKAGTGADWETLWASLTFER